MVSGHSDDISGLQRDVLRRASLMREDGDLIVRVLSTEVVDVVQRAEESRGVRMKSLHDLIRHTAHLIEPEEQSQKSVGREKLKVTK